MPPTTTPHPLVRSTFKQLKRSSGQSFPPPTTRQTISRLSISQQRRRDWEPRPPKPWPLARSQIQNQIRKKRAPLRRSRSRLVDQSRRNGMLLDQLHSSTRERADPAAKALTSSPEDGCGDTGMHEARALRQRRHSGLLDVRAGLGAKAADSSPKDSSEDTEMHEARVLKQRSYRRPADTSRRNGTTPEQFAPFIFRGNSQKLAPSPTRAGRPAANVLKASRSRSFLRGEPIQPFRLR